MILCTLLLALQVPPPKLVPPKLPEAPKTPAEAPVQALVPGVLPADADPAAREAWQKTLAATVLAGGERAPIQGFSLTVDAIVKVSPENINTVVGIYSYLAPGYIRTHVAETSNEHLRGPEGDYLITPTEGAMKLDRSRENELDRRQIDDMVSIARNFVALTDPQRLRIASMKKLAAPPAVVPPASSEADYAQIAAGLKWIEVQSPDFRLLRASQAKGEPLYRVELGLDPQSSLPQLVLIHEGSALARSSVFLKLGGWKESEHYLLPRRIQAFEIDEASTQPVKDAPVRLAFQRDASSDVFVKNAAINPPLTADSFRPPKPKH